MGKESATPKTPCRKSHFLSVAKKKKKCLHRGTFINKSNLSQHCKNTSWDFQGGAKNSLAMVLG